MAAYRGKFSKENSVPKAAETEQALPERSPEEVAAAREERRRRRAEERAKQAEVAAAAEALAAQNAQVAVAGEDDILVELGLDLTFPTLEPAPVEPKAVQKAESAKKEVSKPQKRRAKRPKYLNRNWLLLVLCVVGAWPELLLHMGTARNVATFFSAGLVVPILFAVVPGMILWGVTMMVPKPKVNYGIAVAYSFVMWFLCVVQLVYYKIFGSFFSIDSLGVGTQVLQFMDVAVKAIWENLLLIILMVVPAVALTVLGRRSFSFRPMKKWQMGIGPIVVALVFHLLVVLILPVFGGTKAMSAYDLYHNNADTYYSVNRLGWTTALRLDVVRTLTGFKPRGSINLDGIPPETTTAPTGDANPTETTPLYDTSPNVLDIDFERLIENEDDSDIADIHRFFNSRTPTNKNEYTGMFEGCNLILITAEAFSDLVVTEERTPTLYKLMNEGMTFTNYYVPSWGTSTSDGEYSFLTGTIPIGTNSFMRSIGNEFPLTMVQQLMKQGYNSYAYHGHDYDYYQRDEYLGNLGYNYKGLGNGLEVEDTWPESDLEVVSKTVDEYATNEPFTTYYMTISGHMLYTFEGNYIADKNETLVLDEPYSNNVKAYIATQLELEKSLELLLFKLENAGTLDNTVIVLTADHYPYGLTNEEVSELLGHDVEPNFEVYKNGCIIWKKGMTPITVEEPCSHFDLLPTLSNLFGLEFDSRLYMGRDIFSNATPFVPFSNRSWITDKAMYNAETGEVTSRTGEEISDDYVQRMNNELNNRFTASARILDYDYWEILFG